MRVLIVDDSPIDRLLLTRAFTGAFPQAVLRAVGTSKHEFQAAIEEEQCNLAVIDYALGWADGLEIIRSVRQRWPQCAAILYTVMPSDRLFSQAMDAGFDACLTKSNSPEHLTIAVHALLGDRTDAV